MKELCTFLGPLRVNSKRKSQKTRKILELPKWKALRLVVLNHLVHHRAQLGVFLRLLDVPIPGMFGPSVDEK